MLRRTHKSDDLLKLLQLQSGHRSGRFEVVSDAGCSKLDDRIPNITLFVLLYWGWAGFFMTRLLLSDTIS